jgi:hypothetical protein
LQLDASQAEVLAVEAGTFARAIPDPNVRRRFETLAEAARTGELPDELLSTLETMLELLFSRGRPANRAVLQTIYTRTPRGQQQSIAARDVNRALRTLVGQQLAEIRVSAAPGSHSLVVETDRVRLTLTFDAAGVSVSSLEAG